MAVVVVAGAYFLSFRQFPSELLGVLGVVVGYYFGTRSANGQNGH